MLNLAVLLDDAARTRPDRDAVVFGDTRLSFSAVDAAANQVANLLASRGIGAGDTVALSSPNVPWFPIVYYGILKVGASVVPLNVLLRDREVAYHLRDSGARALFSFEGDSALPLAQICHRGFEQVDSCELMVVMSGDDGQHSPLSGVETLAQALKDQSEVFDSAPTDPTDTAVVLYTSGTTGQPKGAELTHANLVLNALTAHRVLDGREAADTHLIALPLFHAFGQTLQMHAAFAGANTTVLMPRFDPTQAVELMLREEVSHFAGVPTMYHGLLSALPDESSIERIAANLRLALSGGSAMPVELMREVRKQFGVTVREGYGLSETSPGACFTPRDGDVRAGSIGKPIWGVRMRLIDDEWGDVPDSPDAIGEIAVKGHPVMKGYRNRPEATAAVLKDGWFRTGDLARRDADGYYYVIDRAKDMISRGGFKVYPRELEEVLITHPAISMVAVVGVPDEKLGEEVKAFVLKHTDDATTAEEIRAWGKERFASYKYPRLIEFVDAFPMTATGKILKRELDTQS